MSSFQNTVSDVRKLLIVTDLDLSLMDDMYSWSAANPALSRLKTANIPLVLNSSKTLDEMMNLALQLDMFCPLVAENGSLIALPKSDGEYDVELIGLSREYILNKSHNMRVDSGYKFTGFADWTAEQIADCTGLSLETAKRSKSRLASEPILWEDSEARLVEFRSVLAKSQIRLVRGGRFLHLMGFTDKADGTAAVLKFYQAKQPDMDWTIVALGDSENDQAMMDAADIAVVLPHLDGARVMPKCNKVVHASKPSSQGWNKAVLSLLEEYC